MFDYDKNTKEIRAYGEVGYPEEGFTEIDFMRAFDQMGGESVTIRLQSPGGDIFPGLSIMNQIDDYPGNVRVVIDSMAASIASVFPLAADEIVAHSNSRLMVHNPWTVVLGEAEDLRRAAQVLDQLAIGIAKDYSNATGRTVDFWLGEMAATSYYDAEKALELGLIHNIITSESKNQVKETPKSHTGPPRPARARLKAIQAKLAAQAAMLD